MNPAGILTGLIQLTAPLFVRFLNQDLMLSPENSNFVTRKTSISELTHKSNIVIRSQRPFRLRKELKKSLQLNSDSRTFSQVKWAYSFLLRHRRLGQDRYCRIDILGRGFQQNVFLRDAHCNGRNRARCKRVSGLHLVQTSRYLTAQGDLSLEESIESFSPPLQFKLLTCHFDRSPGDQLS